MTIDNMIRDKKLHYDFAEEAAKTLFSSKIDKYDHLRSKDIILLEQTRKLFKKK